MGLVKDVKHYKLVKEVSAIVEEIFGMSIEQIKAKLNEKSTVIETKPTLNELTEKEKKAIEDKYKGKMTPEQIVEKFAGDVEEFYPNGKTISNN